jgi:hypothetical protein
MSYSLYDKLFVTNSGNLGIGTSNLNATIDLYNVSNAIILPSGNTSQRPNNPFLLRYNNDINNLEFKVGNSWNNTVAVPTITSISTNVLKNADDMVDISGTNFDASTNFTFIDVSGNVYNPKQITNLTGNNVRLVRPDWFPPNNAPYTVKVSKQGRYNTYGSITAGVMPTVLTPSGSLGELEANTTITPITIMAQDESGGGILSMSITSGSLPTGLTTSFTNVDASGTFVISGSLGEFSSTTVYPFTLAVYDSGYNLIAVNYSITVNSSGYIYNTYTTSTKNSVVVAYSLRQLNNTYNGAIIKIRRPSDNSEKDFYSSSTTLVDASGNTLNTWLNNTDGYVVTWYDQSGANRHATQTTQAYQPVIFYNPNGYNSVFLNAASTIDPKFLTISSLTLSTPFTFCFVANKIRDGRWIAHNTLSPNPSTPNTLVGYHGTSEASFYMDNIPGSGSGDANVLSRFAVNYNSNHIHFAAKTAKQLEYYYLNGYLKHVNVGGTATNFGSSIILGGGGTNEFSSGYFMEMIIHNISVPNIELDLIQTNISKYYKIPKMPIPTYLSWPDMSNATQIGSTVGWQVTYNSQVYEVTAATQYTNTTESLKDAFDKKGDSAYTTTNLTSLAMVSEQFVRLKFPVAVYAQILRITNGGATNRCIATGEFQVSTDDISWNTIYTFPTQTWVAFETKDYYIYNSTPYQYYRIKVNTFTGSIGSFNFITISEINILHTLAPTVDLPYSISGLQLYLDAAYFNQGRTIWFDRSPNKYDFNVASTAFRNEGGIPHMNFEGSYGSAKRVVNSALTNVPNFTNATFIVFSSILNSTASSRTLLRNSTGDYQIQINSGTNTLGMYDTGTNTFISSGFNITSIPNVYTKFNMLAWKFADSTPFYRFKYNKSQWYDISNNNAVFNSGFCAIGANHNSSTSTTSSNQYWGKVALVLYYNRHLTDTEITNIYEYFEPRFNLNLGITSTQPVDISGNTFTAPVTRSYTFTSANDPSDGNVTWSVYPTTFGNIDVSSGVLNITFPQGTITSGKFTVTAKNSKTLLTQTWSYNIYSYNYNTSLYPVNPWAILDATTLTLSNASNVSSWGIFKEFKQSVTINQPIYYSTGGYNSGAYVFFNRTNSTFLNAGSQLLNISTNGGFSCMCLMQFTGTAGNWERIFDFGNSNPNNNIHFSRNSTSQNMTFELYNTSTSYATTTTTTPIVQNEWAVLTCRWIKSSIRQIYKNNVLQNSTSFGTDILNRVLFNTYIGRSAWPDAYLNANIAKLFIYDRALSDTEMNSLYTKLAEKPFITSTKPTDISQNTSGALYQISYTFTGVASSNTIAWSISPTTYGNINSSSGSLTITFPRYTTASGTFTVTATDSSGNTSTSWSYTITNIPVITSANPSNISQNSSSGAVSIPYTFTANQPVTWSINNSTYGNIDPNTGALTLTFAQDISTSGTFIVTATNAASYTTTQTWTYTIVNTTLITSSQPVSFGASTFSASYDISYNFTANKTVTWSINNTTYGNINSSGYLALSYPQTTDTSGTYVVTATAPFGGSAIQSWSYFITSLESLYAFTSHTFTNATATGRNGPTLANIQTAYSSQSWASNTSYLNMTTQGIQRWTVPKSGTYAFIVAGATGAPGSGYTNLTAGTGKIISGNVTLGLGTVLLIVVGQKGNSSVYYGGGGGGGSFVYSGNISAGSVLFAAGGGGGISYYTSTTANAVSTTSGVNSGNLGGTNGSAGGGGSGGGNGSGNNFSNNPVQGGGGGGLGIDDTATFLGGYGYSEGGFGGGGGSEYYTPGGGGGYSGGAGYGGYYNPGGGGGSYGAPSVINYNNNYGNNSAGAGYVTISSIVLSEYPPVGIGNGDTWSKDAGDTIVGINSVTYRKYKYTVTGAAYGNGEYIAWSNDIFSYLDGSTYNNDEWPPSGAFDKRAGNSNLKSGWHTTGSFSYSSTADATTPVYLAIKLPSSITVQRYSIQSRDGCCSDQLPSKWDLQGSSDSGATWTTIDSRSGITTWTLVETKTFDVTNNTSYQTYRILINRSSGSNYVSIGEISLYAF